MAVIIQKARVFAIVITLFTRVKVKGSGKHTRLLRHGNNYKCKKFYSTNPWWLVDEDAGTLFWRHDIEHNDTEDSDA